jgi:hypothetical protein
LAINKGSTTYTVNTIIQATETDPTGAAGAVNEASAYLLAAGDVLRMFIYQNTGGAATNSDTNFSIQYLRPASV